MQGSLSFKRLGAMIDLSRNAVMNIPALRRLITDLARMGYNTLLLYTEDTYEIPGEPYFGYLRGRYSQEDIRGIVSFAANKGMEVIPCIQTLAHLGSIFHWKAYDSVHDCNDILLAGSEETYALIDKMFASLKSCYKSEYVNIGMDEAHMVGLGKYLDQNGFRDRHEILFDHLERVCRIAEKNGFRPVMWSDMFFRLSQHGVYSSYQPVLRPGISEKIPENVALAYWDYYSEDVKRYRAMFAAHRELGREIWFAGGCWSWTGIAPHNRFSASATKAAFAACREQKVENVFLTLWGDYGGECSRFALLPALYYAACAARGITSIAEIRRGFAEEFGIPYESFCNLDLADVRRDAKNTPPVCNPDRYMLYSDPFTGAADSTVHGGEGAQYRAYIAKAARWEKNAEYGFLFRTSKALARVLSDKYELGYRARCAYQANDKKEMAEVIAACRRLEKSVPQLLEALRGQWFYENKPYGFEIQEIRLAGLTERIRSCRKRLEHWIETGAEIPELEEKLLDIHAGKLPEGEPYRQIQWTKAASVNII